jgi:hypothetical protein
MFRFATLGGRVPITLVNYAQAAAATTPLTINKPTNTAQGDIMVAVMCADTNVTWTGDTDWTEVADLGDTSSLRIAYKVAGASEGASYAFTYAASVKKLSGCIITYRYAAYDTIGAFASPATDVIAPQITAAGGLLLAAYAVSSASRTWSTPSGMASVCSDTDATAPGYAVFSQEINAGATGTRTSTCSTNSGNAGILLSLK